MVQRLQLVAAATDEFQSIAGLFGSATLDRTIIEGFITAQEGGLIMRFGDESRPEATLGGTALPSGGGIGVGPVMRKDAGWPLNAIWIRRQAPGSAATVVVSAVVE